MIPIVIAIIVSITGIYLYNTYKDEDDNKTKKAIAILGVVLPVVAIASVCSFAGFVELSKYTKLKENHMTLIKKISAEQLNDNVSPDTIKNVQKHNKNCEEYYYKYQNSIMWSILGRYRDPALDYRVNISDDIRSYMKHS